MSIVKITSYEPNQLTYEVNSGKGGVVVFSEIYYPGWTATVDGEEQELGRVNYVLRALQVKPGKHQVVLAFFPHPWIPPRPSPMLATSSCSCSLA